MRDIKFRGIGEISKQMVFGDLIHGAGHKKGNVYILPNAHNLAYIKNCDPLDGVRVIAGTVGQYTGLNDKHGKEIYTLDIVKHPQSDEPEDLGWLVDWLATEYIFQNVRTGEVVSGLRFIEYVNSMEIIGNKFENKEL